ncbi:MAG: ribose 5-phosphate isomerase B [candidate division Zixibacteria bacterium]|nr:ribose 5-phosphate isomerase B [candidate division Zixibacteria bacterium]NIR68034.1 ribose 5-phosphate isomerase B [candidate division Zixibacteria bacterium]NIS17543.1 ribose 5-phosphate isomerase B [candidate division Zixibacteria bacterium]NIS49249.1 ribose 5-phosphate isomerase B [candidate division Zixibacteria bacterium]NIT53846.1 ribose 5-phosphate isomerase B [candidate division Zixibacteria bacterium]
MQNNVKKIAIASDHAGFEYKEKIKEHLKKQGYEIMDFGTDSVLPVDYPIFIKAAAEAVSLKKCEAGIVLGGSGTGEAIAANKVKRIRCALCWNVESARLAKEHNDANMISIGQRMITLETAIEIVDEWLKAEFEGGRHQRRINMLEESS